ncbi:MAG TPA: hypothetical protein VM925_28055 [Labilithrix sp.]|nr:hypothetical protein [Labilithrix sp.]
MRPTVIVAFVFATASIVTGCSSSSAEKGATGSSSAAAAASGDAFCETYCQKINSCDSSSDVQTCTATCSDTLDSTIDKLRSDVLAGVQACWDKSDCRQVLGGERLIDCVDETAVSTTPSAAAKSFCDALAAGLDKCDAGIDRADCLETSKVYSDEALEQAAKCTSKSCSTIMDCVNATL